MGFETIPGLPGKIYVPDPPENCCKKHPCKDCFSCEWCAEDRCRVCRSTSCRESGTDRAKD